MTTPQKSNIDTKNCHFLRVKHYLFQGPSFWGPGTAVSELGGYSKWFLDSTNDGGHPVATHQLTKLWSFSIHARCVYMNIYIYIHANCIYEYIYICVLYHLIHLSYKIESSNYNMFFCESDIYYITCNSPTIQSHQPVAHLEILKALFSIPLVRFQPWCGTSSWSESCEKKASTHQEGTSLYRYGGWFGMFWAVS